MTKNILFVTLLKKEYNLLFRVQYEKRNNYRVRAESFNGHRNFSADFLNPKRIIIFGSRISGRGREYSDFDIAVEGTEMNIRNERLLKDALDDKLGIITVDLINLDKVDSKFKQLVLQTGRVIYEQ